MENAQESITQNSEPSLNDVINDNFGEPASHNRIDVPPEQVKPVEEEEDPRQKLDRFNEQAERQRAAWRQEQKLKKEREQIKKEREEIEKLKKNPKELFGTSDINEVIDRMFDGERDEKENDKKTDAELYEEIEKRVYEKLKAEQTTEIEKEATEREIREFDSSVKSYLTSQQDKYSLVNAMGEHTLVREVIQADFKQNLEAYGPERAQQMIMNVDQAAERVEKHLESEIKKVVEYPGMRDYLMKVLGTNSGQPQANNPKVNNRSGHTLTNDFASSTDAAIVDDPAMTEQEAFNRALALLK